jgi:hypothetical protein
MTAIFVKSADTKVSVEKSQADLLAILRRYGARDFGFDEDPNGKEASVRFRITRDGRDLPILMRVDVEAVYQAMYRGRKAQVRGRNVSATWRDQSKRTAWRLLVDWIDAACSTTTVGIQSVEEVFLAHVVVRNQDGHSRRLIQAFHELQVAGGLPLALPAGGAP